MKRWLTKIIEEQSADSVSKARNDISTIGRTMGYAPVYIYRYFDAGENEYALNSRIDGITAGIATGDFLVYQYPSYNEMRFDETFIARMKQRRIKVALLIHDVESLRGYYRFDEIALFNQADILIIHGPQMAISLEKAGVKTQMIEKALFDYLPDGNIQILTNQLKKQIVFAGNIQKSPFLRHWTNQTEILVYGETTDTQFGKNVSYQGVLTQRTLLEKLPNDVFGIAWDDNLVNGGQYQNYTRYNAPHKLSLYLSQGLPVIVWSQSAAAELVRHHHIGITISQIEDLDAQLQQLSQEELLRMKQNANGFSQVLQNGLYTRRALMNAEIQLLSPSKGGLLSVE